MTRARAILFSVLAAWIVVAVADCSGDARGMRAAAQSLETVLLGDSGNQHRPDAATPLALAANHSVRRVHFQPRADGADSFFGSAQMPSIACKTQFDSSIFSRPDPALTQRWQFLWRTAPEPRAPSLVS